MRVGEGPGCEMGDLARWAILRISEGRSCGLADLTDKGRGDLAGWLILRVVLNGDLDGRYLPLVFMLLFILSFYGVICPLLLCGQYLTTIRVFGVYVNKNRRFSARFSKFSFVFQPLRAASASMRIVLT